MNKQYATSLALVAALAMTPLASAFADNASRPGMATPPRSALLQFEPVQTSDDWASAGLSLKRAKVSPGVWYYRLDSSRTGQSILFMATSDGQAKLLFANRTSNGQEAIGGIQAENGTDATANVSCETGCHTHIEPGPGNTHIVTVTSDAGQVVTVYSVDANGKVTVLYSLH